MIIYGHDAAVAAWAGDLLGIKDFGPCSTIGVVKNGDLIAAVVYHQYRHPNIEASIATIDKRWATRHNLRAIFRYPFVQLGCKRITAITEVTNQRARAFLCHLGFTQEGYHVDALPTGDAVTYGILRQAASKWFEEDIPIGEVGTVSTCSP